MNLRRGKMTIHNDCPKKAELLRAGKHVLHEKTSEGVSVVLIEVNGTSQSSTSCPANFCHLFGLSFNCL